VEQGGEVLGREARLITEKDGPTFRNVRSANDEYCADEVIELASANDRCWHFSAVPTAPRNVGYQG
jgi:hypothetical protein